MQLHYAFRIYGGVSEICQTGFTFGSPKWQKQSHTSTADLDYASSSETLLAIH